MRPQIKVYSKEEKSKRSHDSRNYYRWYKRRKDNNYNLTESQYSHILKDILEDLFEKMMNFEAINLPFNVGIIFIDKHDGGFQLEKGKMKRRDYIDWQKTKQVWEACPEERKKTYVFMGLKQVYYFKHKYKKHGFKNYKYFRIRLRKDLYKRIFHELTLNEKPNKWLNNMFQ